MPILVTCGHPDSGYQLAYEALVQAGLAYPKPSCGDCVSPEDLHGMIFSEDTLDSSGFRPSMLMVPENAWRDIGVALFASNGEEENWGWADSRSVWLLNFWKDLDPHVRFILVFSAPELVLAKVLGDNPTPDNIPSVLAGWMAYHTEILRFYNRNPERSLLVNVSAIISDANVLVDKAIGSFGMELIHLAPEFLLDTGRTSPIITTLAKALIEDEEDAYSLYRQLDSAADIPDNEKRRSDAEKRRALDEYSALLVSIDTTKTEAVANSDYANKLEDEQSRLAAELQAHDFLLTEARNEQARLSSLLQAQDSQLLAVQSRYDSLEHEQARLLRQFKGLEENLGNERAIASTRQVELIQENELLLLQLRQVQEELEYRFVQESENSESSNSSKDEQARLATEQQSRIQQLTAELEAQTTLLKDYQTKVHGLTVELDEQTQIVVARQTAIGQLTKALDEQTGLAAVRQTAIEELTKALDEQTGLAAARQTAIEELTKALDEQAGLAAARQTAVQELTMVLEKQTAVAAGLQATSRELIPLQAECERLKHDNAWLQEQVATLHAGITNVQASAAAEQAALAQENELLLLQLQQVQDELEHYLVQEHSLSEMALAKGKAAEEASTSLINRLWRKHQPSEVVIDFRDEIEGENWYDAEFDGRWAGPASVSTLRLPALRTGRYEFYLDVVDAMDPGIIAGTSVFLNGSPFPTAVDGEGYQVIVLGEFSVDAAAQHPVWEFRFEFPKLMSPLLRGSNDKRTLAIRVRSLKLRVTP